MSPIDGNGFDATEALHAALGFGEGQDHSDSEVWAGENSFCMPRRRASNSSGFLRKDDGSREGSMLEEFWEERCLPSGVRGPPV